MNTAAPFLLEPALAERVWGGCRLGPGIGEAWDLSTHPHGLARVCSGPHSGRTLAEVVDGEPHHFGGPIDLLAKRLDCAENLSVQVHPTVGDAKTEAWVILDADPGAGVYLGFSRPVTPEEVAARAVDGSVHELLAFTVVAPGDVIFVPAGTVHAIGGGLSLFELQQASDTTYRLFDWGRAGRELHLEAGLACAELDVASPTPAGTAIGPGVERVIACPWFVIDRLAASGTAAQLRVDPGSRWSALLVVAGSARLGDLQIQAGQTAMVPASSGVVPLQADADFVGLHYGPADSESGVS